jgi:large subunit ribosomal protein L19e
MGLKTVRRLAAKIMRVGENRIRFDPSTLAKAGEALTHDDVRGLIDSGAITKERAIGVSRIRAKLRQIQRKAGRQRGHGKRKGTMSARHNSKDAWIAKARSQRRYLFGLLDAGKLDKATGRKIYSMIKGGAFKGVSSVELYLKNNNLLR